MNDLTLIGNTPTMTSMEMVEFINSQRKEGEAELRHRDFTAKVPKVLGEEMSEKFRTSLKDSYGRDQPGYRFPKREACLMAMSYSYDLQAKVYDRMTALEAKAATKPANRISKDAGAMESFRLARAAEINMKTAERIFAHLPNLGSNAKQCILANMINPVMGAEVIALPKVSEHMRLASEFAGELGTTPNMIGRIANAHGLKTPEHGEVRLNKAQGHDRQIESFYYNERGVQAIADVLRKRGEVA